MYLERRGLPHPFEYAATSHAEPRHTRDTGNQTDCRHVARYCSTSTAHPMQSAHAPTTTGANLSRQNDASQTDSRPCHADQAAHTAR